MALSCPDRSCILSRRVSQGEYVILMLFRFAPHLKVNVISRLLLVATFIFLYVLFVEPTVAVHLALWYVVLVCHKSVVMSYVNCGDDG